MGERRPSGAGRAAGATGQTAIMARVWRVRGGLRAWRTPVRPAALLCALFLLAGLASPAPPAHAQSASVVVEQSVAPGVGGLVSAPLDPARRYSLVVLSGTDGGSFHGSYSQNWFLRDGARRAGSNEGTLGGRAPWEQELRPPATALAQWTYAASVWNDSSATMTVRLLDHGPR